MSNLDPAILAQGPDPRRSLAEAILAVLGGGGRTPVLSQNAPGVLFNNPIRLEELTVVGTPTRQVAPDATAFQREPTLPAMRALPGDGQPDPQAVLERTGTLPQIAARDTALARRIYEAVQPYGYGLEQGGPPVKNMPPDGVDYGQLQNRAIRVGRAMLGFENSPRDQERHEREDAWRMYLGLPQLGGTFAVSRHRPARSSDPDAIYFSIPRFLQNLAAQAPDHRAPLPERERWAVQQILKGMGRSRSMVLVDDDSRTKVMGDYTIARGEDERGHYISYYDKWDLNPNYELGNRMLQGAAANVLNRVGKPFEIYDRIYYDPKTFKVIQPGRRQ